MSQYPGIHKGIVFKEEGRRKINWQIPMMAIGLLLLALLVGLVVNDVLVGSETAVLERNHLAVNPELKVAYRYAEAAAARAAVVSPATNPELMWANRYAATNNTAAAFMAKNPEIRLFQQYQPSLAAQLAAQLADYRFLATNPEIKAYRYFVATSNNQ